MESLSFPYTAICIQVCVVYCLRLHLTSTRMKNLCKIFQRPLRSKSVCENLSSAQTVLDLVKGKLVSPLLCSAKIVQSPRNPQRLETIEAKT